MGFGGENYQKKTYITIGGGKFCIRVTNTTEGAVQRIITNKKTGEKKEVFELQANEVSGMIKRLNHVVKDFGTFIEIIIEDDKLYCVQIPWQMYSIRDGFLKRIPNVDYKKPVALVIFIDKDTQRPVLFIRQDGKSVPLKYTKENPNGLPAPKEVIRQGVKKLDFSEAEEFMYSLLLKEDERIGGRVDPQENDGLEFTDEITGEEENGPCPF